MNYSNRIAIGVLCLVGLTACDSGGNPQQQQTASPAQGTIQQPEVAAAGSADATAVRFPVKCGCIDMAMLFAPFW